MNKPTFKHICLMHIQQLTNFPYIEKDFDALTDYGLLCKVVDYLNQVITNENTQNENIVALYNAFVELKDFVDNYFDNLDVQDEINNKLDEMASDGTLEQLLNVNVINNIKSNVQRIYNHNKFKPIVRASMYTLDHDENTIKNRILKWKEMNVKGIIVLIDFNNDEELTIQNNLTKTKNLMNFAKENGLEVDTIKFHCLLRDRVDSTTLTTYYNQVVHVLESLDAFNFGIKRLTLFNELNYVYGAIAESETKTQAIEIIEAIQELGYKVGISCSNLELGLGYMIQYSPNIANAVDYFAFNYYQVFPFKKEYTTEEDSIYSWDKNLEAIYTYKRLYPEKDIILSETGCLDNWLNMTNPADFTLNQYPANGKAYPIYFYGLLNNKTANTTLSEVWLWYDEVLTNYDEVIEYFKYYLGGDLND